MAVALESAPAFAETPAPGSMSEDHALRLGVGIEGGPGFITEHGLGWWVGAFFSVEQPLSWTWSVRLDPGILYMSGSRFDPGPASDEPHYPGTPPEGALEEAMVVGLLVRALAGYRVATPFTFYAGVVSGMLRGSVVAEGFCGEGAFWGIPLGGSIGGLIHSEDRSGFNAGAQVDVFYIPFPECNLRRESVSDAWLVPADQPTGGASLRVGYS